jgi:hypothetical protein
MCICSFDILGTSSYYKGVRNKPRERREGETSMEANQYDPDAKVCGPCPSCGKSIVIPRGYAKRKCKCGLMVYSSDLRGKFEEKQQ